MSQITLCLLASYQKNKQTTNFFYVNNRKQAINIFYYQFVLLFCRTIKMYRIYLGCCKLENKILKEAKSLEKGLKTIILRPKNVTLSVFGLFQNLIFQLAAP